MKRAPLPLIGLAALAMAGCSGTVEGQPSRAEDGMLPTAPASTEQRTSTTAPSTTTARRRSGSDTDLYAVFGGLKPCELVRPDQQPFPFGTAEEKKDVNGNSQSCSYFMTRRPIVSIRFLPTTKAAELTYRAGTKGKSAAVTIGRHSGFEIDNGQASCYVVFAIDENASVEVALAADRESIDELRGLTRKVAEIVETKLPVV